MKVCVQSEEREEEGINISAECVYFAGGGDARIHARTTDSNWSAAEHSAGLHPWIWQFAFSLLSVNMPRHTHLDGGLLVLLLLVLPLGHLRQRGGGARVRHCAAACRALICFLLSDLAYRGGSTLLMHAYLCAIAVCSCMHAHTTHCPTLRGSFCRPTSRACPYGLVEVPSSWFFTITAFLPANRPERTTTTFPGCEQHTQT